MPTASSRWGHSNVAARIMEIIENALADGAGAKDSAVEAELAGEEASPMPRSDFGQKVIFWAFYRQSSNFAALAQLLRARARAGDRKGHITG